MSAEGVWDFEIDELPYRVQLQRTALRLTRSVERAEDLVQETYLKAYRRYGTFRPGTNLRAWLFTILKNTFINDYRQSKKRPALVAFTSFEETLESALLPVHGPAARTPEDEVVDATLDDDVRRGLAELPAVYKAVILLVDIEGHTYKEAAAILSIPVGTVMSRLYRGRRLLEPALLSFGVRTNYLVRRPVRVRSSDLDLERLFGVAAATAG